MLPPLGNWRLWLRWSLLNALLWPVGLWVDWLLVYSLLSSFPARLLAACPTTIELQIVRSPLFTPNPCRQLGLALIVCWAGITVGYLAGYLQWRLFRRQLPAPWIVSNAIGHAIGSPLAYLVYLAAQPYLPAQPWQLAELTLFLWIWLCSRWLSAVGAQWRWKRREVRANP